jgi:hypothetical protein
LSHQSIDDGRRRPGSLVPVRCKRSGTANGRCGAARVIPRPTSVLSLGWACVRPRRQGPTDPLMPRDYRPQGGDRPWRDGTAVRRRECDGRRLRTPDHSPRAWACSACPVATGRGPSVPRDGVPGIVCLYCRCCRFRPSPFLSCALRARTRVDIDRASPTKPTQTDIPQGAIMVRPRAGCSRRAAGRSDRR